MSYPMAMIVLAVAGALLVVVGLAFFLRPRWILGWLKGMLVLSLIVVGGYAGLVAWNLSLYQSVEGMETVAVIESKQLGSQLWQITLSPMGEEARTVRINGDQWQVDARIIRFGGPMQWLGVLPGYRLERLSGRYMRLEQERSGPRSVIGLAAQPWPDLWSLDQTFNLPFIEAVYGNATFMPLADGATFDVRLSSSGLVAVPVNDEARLAVRRWGD